MKLAVAIYVPDRIELLTKAIQGVYAGIATDFELTLLADGMLIPEHYLEGSYQTQAVMHWQEAVGAPVAMNAWLANCAADVTHFLFLENGLLLGHNCVAQLIAALDSSPAIGLAGPSTNACWNEQHLPWPCADGLENVHAIAAKISLMYGSELLSLAPLYSLAPFCLAFTRALVDAIGGACADYQDGPCWEMDLHARAERAGLQGLLVLGAYAWRSHPSSVVVQREARLFQANKHLYQDRLCALKLLNKTDGYELHCKGDVCEHFAPRDLVALKTELPAPTLQAPQDAQDAAPLPMISCIMPTARRPQFVAQAITYFLRQDYPAKELIIVYDQPSDLPADLVQHPAIRCHQMAWPQSIGNKRNMALSLSQGELIALWDDDDWYHPTRLRRQVAPILLGLADIVGMQYPTLYAIQEGRFWRPGVGLFQRMFRQSVVAGSIIYRKSIVERGVYYPDLSMIEDAYFLERAMGTGARLLRIPAEGIYHYVRHGNNTWRFVEGQFLQPDDWQEVRGAAYFAEDAAFYAHLVGRAEEESSAASQPTSNATVVAANAQDLPLVSCIMPTANRAAFIPQAIQHFLAQDYPNKELIIIDDGRESVAHLIPSHPHIHYRYFAYRQTIGAKRNLACTMAQGATILHWDDDDWIAPTWISTQVESLNHHGADITGLTSIRFYDPMQRKAWLYQYPEGNPSWICGGTMCYRKSYWERNPFTDIDIGEDNAFVWSAVPKVIAPHQGVHLYAARVHSGNTSAKQTQGSWWQPIAFEVIEEMMRG